MKQTKTIILVLDENEWLNSLENLYLVNGHKRVNSKLKLLKIKAKRYHLKISDEILQPNVNTTKVNLHTLYPGLKNVEHHLKSMIRWNAVPMVLKVNKKESGISEHISTFDIASTLYEVRFHHYFWAQNEDQERDIIYFQDHALPGLYARTFHEGRLSGYDLGNFIRELDTDGGLPFFIN